jgi:hypothetical protein
MTASNPESVSLALLAGGHKAAIVLIVQLTSPSHAIALRYDTQASKWLVLDSVADAPYPLLERPCIGAVYALTRVDSEAEFLPESLRTHLRPAQGMYHLAVLGPLNTLKGIVGDLGAASWLHAQPARLLRMTAAHATSVALVSDTCIKIGLTAAVANNLLPTAAHVHSLSVALRKSCSCRCVLQEAPVSSTAQRRTATVATRLQPQHPTGICLSSRFAPLLHTATDADEAEPVHYGPQLRTAAAVAAPGGSAGEYLKAASWNATTLTEPKVYELLTKASKEHVLVVAVQEMGTQGSSILKPGQQRATPLGGDA